MLRPTPMKHVRILVLGEDLPQASLTLAELESFHADARAPEHDDLDGQPGLPYRDTWRQASSRLEKITKLIPLPTEGAPLNPRVIPEEELVETNNWLGGVWEETSHYEEQFRAIDDEDRLIREQQSALSNFEDLNIDLGMLRSKTRFLDFYVGVVPYANVRQLEGAVGLADHLLFQYMVTGDDAHVVIVGPSGDKEAQLESVLRSAGFRHLPIPPELDHEPQVMRAELTRRREATTAQRQALSQRLADWSAGLLERLLASREILRLAEPLVQLDAAIRGRGALAHLTGWVPAAAVKKLETRLRETLSLPFALTSRDPLPEERSLVPTVPTRKRLLAPFALLVHQYGIPRYGEVDPTPLFAATFLLMFGTMFGDVGQGAVIAGLAWYFRARLGRFYLFWAHGGCLVHDLRPPVRQRLRLRALAAGPLDVAPARPLAHAAAGPGLGRPLHRPGLRPGHLQSRRDRQLAGGPLRPARPGQPHLLPGPGLGRAERRPGSGLRSRPHPADPPLPRRPGLARLGAPGCPRLGKGAGGLHRDPGDHRRLCLQHPVLPARGGLQPQPRGPGPGRLHPRRHDGALSAMA